MSWVSTVIVASDYLTDDDKTFINETAAEHNRAQATFAEPDHCGPAFGGSKCAESTVLLGAFNYLAVEDFIAELRTRKFHGGIYVLVFSNGEFISTYMQDESPVNAPLAISHIHDVQGQ